MLLHVEGNAIAASQYRTVRINNLGPKLVFAADHLGKQLQHVISDDGQNALKIADDTGYVWANVDSLKLLASYHETRAKLPKANKAEEKESAQRYAKEAAKIERDLFLTEKQMSELKVKAKKEFEKQTAGWE